MDHITHENNVKVEQNTKMQQFSYHKIDVLKRKHFELGFKCPLFCRTIFSNSESVDLDEIDNVQFELEALLINSLERLDALTNQPKRQYTHWNNNIKELPYNCNENQCRDNEDVNANSLPNIYEELGQIINTPYPAMYVNDRASEFWGIVHDRDHPLTTNDLMLLGTYCKTRTLLENYSFNQDLIEKKEEIILKTQTPKKELKTLMNNFMEPVLGKIKKTQKSVQFGHLTQRLMSSMIEIPEKADNVETSSVAPREELMETNQMQVNCVERCTFNVLHSLGLVSEQHPRGQSQLSALVRLVNKQSQRNQTHLRHLIKSTLSETVQRKMDDFLIHLNTEIYDHFKNLNLAQNNKVPINEAERERFNQLCILANKVTRYLDL